MLCRVLTRVYPVVTFTLKIKCPCRCNHGKEVQHAHFMPINSGCGKERRILIGPW